MIKILYQLYSTDCHKIFLSFFRKKWQSVEFMSFFFLRLRFTPKKKNTLVSYFCCFELVIFFHLIGNMGRVKNKEKFRHGKKKKIYSKEIQMKMKIFFKMKIWMSSGLTNNNERISRKKKGNVIWLNWLKRWVWMRR